VLPKSLKEPGETIAETSRYVRPERAYKWPNSVLARWWSVFYRQSTVYLLRISRLTDGLLGR